MTTSTEHIAGREWLLFPGCRPVAVRDLSSGDDPATATHFATEGGAWGPVPSEAVAAPRPATKAAKKKAGGGSMFSGGGHAR